MNKIVAGLFLLLISNHICASENSLWLNDTSSCNLDEASRQILWNQEGHLNTTYIVARIAGHDVQNAKVLSCFSQMPDREVMRLSAPAVAIWGIFSWEYRHMIMAVLHSLHGGEVIKVHERREKLANLVKESLKNDKQDYWKSGFMIHAMGDSYAHVSGSGGEMHAYGELVGHAFAFCEKPDEISHDDNFKNYSEFVRKLFDSLRIDGANEQKLDDFLATVQKAAETGDEDNVKRSIYNYPLNNNDTLTLLSHKEDSFNFSPQDEKEFLRQLRTELE